MSISLSLQGLGELDYAQVLQRLMRRQNIVLITRAIRALSILVAVIASIIIVTVAIRDTLHRKGLEGELEGRLGVIVSSMSEASTTANPPSRDWSLISDHQPFGPLGKTEAAPAAAQPPPSPLSLSLLGTFITEGQEPYAIIEDKKKQNQDMFLIDQKIFEQATLKKIFRDRVEIERLGKIEVLKLDEFGGGGDSAGSGGITSNGDDFVVDEAELDKGLENLPLLLTQARAVPYFKDGRSIGLRLFAIKSESLYEKIGLKNGDILKSINGNSLADITQALKLFEQLKQERSINLVLERDKQDREFKYTIR